MRIARANANQYLVVARRGTLVNRGVAGRAFLWPGASHVLLPSTKQEASFAMTQETRDGVPLRFKGIVIYRVTRPEQAARLFGFADGRGEQEIGALISHVCLGELRARVAHMTMVECVEQRKTTLTDVIASALGQIVHGEEAWGIELEVVQVAQVFIIDDELRRQLEAEVRDRIRATSELSDIQSRREVQQGQLAAERELDLARLESERRRGEVEREKLRLRTQLEQERADADAAVALRQIERARVVLEQELEQRRLETAVQALRVEAEMLKPRAEQELRREILPQEQVTAVAAALSGMLQGTSLSVYGGDFQPLAMLEPLVRLLAERVQKGLPRE